MFKLFDATARQPREIQSRILGWLERKWDLADVFAIQTPTGTGKQAIGRAIQIAHGAHYIAPSNILLNQALETYPDANFLMGKEHYKCKTVKDSSCEDMKRTCDDCVFTAHRNRAKAKEPTMFNPMSYYYLKQDQKFKTPKVLVVDEAHQILSMISGLGTVSLSRRKYGAPGADLQAWLQKVSGNLRAQQAVALKRKDFDTFRYNTGLLNTIERVLHIHENTPNNIALTTTSTVVIVEPVIPPAHLLRYLLNADKLILMSATLLRDDALELATGRPMLYLDTPSPIAVERRLVKIEPVAREVNFNTAPSTLVGWIKAKLKAHPGENAIVHLPYGWVEKLAPYFPGALTHTAATKNDTLAHFKENGGLWLAGGCAEGIDLAGDVCRVNLIPILNFPSITAASVQQLLKRDDGQRRYDMSILRTVIQQVGRTTRGPTDYSITYIGDPRLTKLIAAYRNILPRAFLEAVRT